MSTRAYPVPSRRLPILTLATLGPTALLTSTRLFTDGPLDALRRDPSALGHDQVWRLVSPILVQSDKGITSVVLVFAVCAAIGIYAERFFSPGRWLTLYLVGALSGHSLGEAFQPLEGGISVAFVGILGGLAAYSLLNVDEDLQRPGGFRPRARCPCPDAPRPADEILQRRRQVECRRPHLPARRLRRRLRPPLRRGAAPLVGRPGRQGGDGPLPPELHPAGIQGELR
jgi:hypothetical protein